MTGRPDEKTPADDLHAAIRARDELLAVAAHELRNPMHALALEASGALRAARKNGDPVIVTRLERMVLAINRYVQRANTLLDVSRINAGQLHLRREKVDLSRVVAEAVAAYEAEAAHHGVIFEVQITEPLVGWWDRVALEQAASNLLSNAMKYGAGQPVQVELKADEGEAVMTVRDNGIGMSDADQRRIFQQFEQLMTGERRAGFGIGLWLTRSLVEAHGGKIEVESAVGSGSTFTVRLPRGESVGGSNG